MTPSGAGSCTSPSPTSSPPRTARPRPARAHLTEDPSARSAILAWAVAGCLAWQRDGAGVHGLRVPKIVTDYTAAYRAEVDDLGGWLEDCCTIDAKLSTPVGALRASYERWARANGEQPLSAKALGSALEARGFTQPRTGARRFRRGLALRVTDDA